MDALTRYRVRSSSRGYKFDPPALIHPMILIGAGEMLTYSFMKVYKITHVINCAEDNMCPSWFSSGFPDRYVCLNAIDSLDVNILDWYPKFKETLQSFLQDPECTRVFVHCQCGINRSAFLALMYVCDVFGFQFTQTESSVIRGRPCALTNPSFRRQIMDALTKKAL